MYGDEADSGSSADRPGFRIREGSHDSVVVLAVEDVVDLMTAPQLSEAINDALERSPRALVVDLTDVTFLASAGMTTLAKGAEQAGATVRFGVVADSPTTSRPLRLLGIDKMLSIYPTLDDAIRDLR